MSTQITDAVAKGETSTDPNLFELLNIQKQYQHFRALDGITFTVKQGSIGLLGPNGAGKSTLIKLLLGLLKGDGGSARVLGYEVPHQAQQLRAEVGYMPENDSYLPYMTAVDYVCFAGQLLGMPPKEAFRRAHEVLEYVGLGEARYRELAGFSTGMKQRVKLAQALVHGPKLVFLDEPTNGLDPKGRMQMLELLKDVKKNEIQLVLSSHILPDVEEVCDYVVMLDEGRLLYDGPLEDLYGSDDHSIEFDTFTRDGNDQLIKLFKQSGFLVRCDNLLPEVIVRSLDQRQEILKIAVENGMVLRHFVPSQVSLQAAFLQLLDRSRDR